jgi:SAM-dependent methyltransferase
MKKSLKSFNQLTRAAYNLAGDRYHELFRNEMQEKPFDRELLDQFAVNFGPSSLILDAGCGPSGHIGRYMSDKGLRVFGIDISDQCIAIASAWNPGMQFQVMDMGCTAFRSETMDGILSYYAIIHTPKYYLDIIFAEYSRILRRGGKLLVTVKAGAKDGFQEEFLGFPVRIYFSLFSEEELKNLFLRNGFQILYFMSRNPYEGEIRVSRYYVIGEKN